MASTKVFLLVLSLAISVGMCWCEGEGEDAVSMAKTTLEEVNNNSPETMAKSESKAESKVTKDKAENTASSSTQTMDSAASGASEHAPHKSSKVKVKQAMGYAKTAEAYNEVDEMIHKKTDKPTLSRNAEDDKAAEAYVQAKQKVGETYKSSKDSMTEGAKATYENAKEKASQATGDLGAKMKSSNR